MYRRTIAAALMLVAGTGVSGCAMPRHSNMMVFGTNTSFGITAGTGATNIPSVTVGYRRQEAVLLPLLANTGEQSDGALKPCPSTGATPPATCVFVGKAGSDTIDSYSVMASFGAKYGGQNDGTSASAKGAIAQYFATGLAARSLAENAGAAAVSTGDAAGKAVIAGSPAMVGQITPARVKMIAARTNVALSQIAATVQQSAANYPAILKTLDSKTSTGGTEFQTACASAATAAACAPILSAGTGLDMLTVSDLEAAAK